MRRREEEESQQLPQRPPQRPPEIPQVQKERIISALHERGAVRPCPRCGNSNFTLLDGYFTQTVQTEPIGIVIGGPTLPTIVVVCTKCGYLSQHALGALGLLLKPEGTISEEVKK